MLAIHPKKQILSDAKVLNLSIVVPCFNEAEGLGQLADRLQFLQSTFDGKWVLEVILVDDGSSDNTWLGLQDLFAQHKWCRLVRHDLNRGITASIRTGIEHATNELVVSIDADCTYDPIQIRALVDSMSDEVAMVTASPYHPQGEVVGVPRWRLALSRMASTGYGMLLGTSLHTYTSCFRLYRKSVIAQLPDCNGGFVGVAEMLWQIQQQGGNIVEVPARLTSRKIGFSKMRTLPVIIAHLKLMARILVGRFSKK